MNPLWRVLTMFAVLESGGVSSLGPVCKLVAIIASRGRGLRHAAVTESKAFAAGCELKAMKWQVQKHAPLCMFEEVENRM